MFRYLIVTGDPNSEFDARSINQISARHQSSGSEWRSMINDRGFYSGYFDSPGAPDAAIPLQGAVGVIYGRIYDAFDGSGSQSPQRLSSIPSNRSAEITRSMGRSLLSRYWGYYVAVLRSHNGLVTVVIRSPVSPLSCFHMHVGTLNVFFSHLDDLAELELPALSVNWDSIIAQVVGTDYLTDETAIEQIRSMECGEAMHCTFNGCVKHVYWDARLIASNRSLDCFSGATHAMRRATDYSVNALSSDHAHILVSLSGGLDSSIVLSALARASHRPALDAVNYYSRGCGDERYFARRMAEATGTPVFEFLRNDNLDLRKLNNCNHTVRPVLNFSAPDVEARNTLLARELGATAVFNGELGDNIFGRVPDPGVLLECFRRNGFGSRFVSLAMDYSLLTNQSIWQTLTLALRVRRDIANAPDLSMSKNLQERYGMERAKSLTLASADAENHYRGMIDRYRHPWFQGARELAPGSDGLLFGLVAVTSPLYHSPFAGPNDPPQVSPLVSQPLAEVALQIPNYFHCRNGQDRSVARAAFADALPVAILHRGSGKGGPDLWAREVVDNNTEFLRSLLLDGILAQRGLIDRNKLEAVLSADMVKSSAIIGDVFAKSYIEVWLRNFQEVEGSRVSRLKMRCTSGFANGRDE